MYSSQGVSGRGKGGEQGSMQRESFSLDNATTVL